MQGVSEGALLELIERARWVTSTGLGDLLDTEEVEEKVLRCPRCGARADRITWSVEVVKVPRPEYLVKAWDHDTGADEVRVVVARCWDCDSVALGAA
jgi:hypothetical protein